MPGMPGSVIDEKDNLLKFVAQQAYTLRLSAWGLTDEQARSTPTASSLSVGGTIKHVTTVLRAVVLQVADQPVPEGDRDAEFVMAGGEHIADLSDDLDCAVAELRAAVADQPLDRELPIEPAPWMPDVPALQLRNRLAHMIDEVARHNGHADIIRESIDGVDAGALMAGSESWPPNPWIAAYQPPTS